MWPFGKKKERGGHAREWSELTLGNQHAYESPADDSVWGWLKRAPSDYFIEGWAEMDPEGFEDYARWPRNVKGVRAARAIRRHVLELILAASKDQYPQEFGAMLRATNGVIEELILVPGTISGDSHAIFQFHMLPIDMDIIGTIHSHPSPIPYPSAADTHLFEQQGRVHIITGHPFGPNDWNAFDHHSHLVDLEVLD